MGLFDSYKQTYSSPISMYVGNSLSELKDLKKERTDQYLLGQEYQSAIGDLIAQAPASSQSKELLNGVVSDASSRLDEWSKREDVENLTPELHRYARKLKSTLGIIASDKQKEDAYMADLDKAKVSDPRKKAIAMQMARDNSTPMTIDEHGRAVGGFKRGIDLVDDVDMPKIIQERLAVLHESSTGRKTKVDNGQLLEFREGSWKGITQEQIAPFYDSLVKLDPSISAYMHQTAELEAYDQTRKATDESVSSYLETIPENSPLRVKVEELMAKNFSPKEAYAAAVKDDVLAHTYKLGLQFANGKAYNEFVNVRELEPGFEAKENIKNENALALHKAEKNYDNAHPSETDKSKDSEFLVSPMAMGQNFGYNNIMELRQKGIPETQKEIESAQLKYNSAKARAASGTPQEKADAQAEMEYYDGILKEAKSKHESLLEIDEKAKRKAATELGYNYSEIKEGAVKEIKNQLPARWKKGIPIKGGKGVITPDELAKAIAEGRVKPIGIVAPIRTGGGPGQKYVQTGVEISIDGITYKLPASSSDLTEFSSKVTSENIKNLRNIDKRSFDFESEGLIDMGSSLTDAQSKMLNSNLYASKYINGKGEEDTIPDDWDLSKSKTVKASNSSGNVLVDVVDKEGKSVGQHTFRMDQTNINHVLGKAKLSTKDPVYQQMGAKQLTDFGKSYSDLFTKGLTLKKLRNGKDLVVQDGAEGTPTKIQIKYNQTSKSYYLTDESGNKIGRNLSQNEAENLIFELENQ